MAMNAVGRWHARAHWLHQHRVPVLPTTISRMLRILFGCELPPTVELGPGVQLLHNGLGVVMHPRVKVGEGTLILANVTIGGNGRGFGGVPEIKDHVYIGAGAVIVGPVVVGARARVGANAVVTKDVPDGYVALGVPAVARPPRDRAADDSEQAAVET